MSEMFVRGTILKRKNPRQAGPASGTGTGKWFRCRPRRGKLYKPIKTSVGPLYLFN